MGENSPGSLWVGRQKGICGVARLVRSVHYALRRGPCIRFFSRPTRLTGHTQIGSLTRVATKKVETQRSTLFHQAGLFAPRRSAPCFAAELPPLHVAAFTGVRLTFVHSPGDGESGARARLTFRPPAVAPSLAQKGGRHGSNACVRRVTRGAMCTSRGWPRMATPGLGIAGKRRPMVPQGLGEAWIAQRNGFTAVRDTVRCSVVFTIACRSS
jgi:hypothetical protein